MVAWRNDLRDNEYAKYTTIVELLTMTQTINLEYEIVHKCMRVVNSVSQMIP